MTFRVIFLTPLSADMGVGVKVTLGEGERLLDEVVDRVELVECWRRGPVLGPGNTSSLGEMAGGSQLVIRVVKTGNG
jgi:hypothetical protein